MKRKNTSPPNRCQEESGTLSDQMSEEGLKIKKRQKINNNQGKGKRKRESAQTTEAISVVKESQARAKQQRLIENLQTRDMPTQDIKPDPIPRDKDLLPFWNEYTKERSQELLLHTRTGCVDTDLSWSNGSSANIPLKSWFTVTSKKLQLQHQQKVEQSDINLQMTLLPSSPTLWQDVMDDAQQQTDKRESERVKKHQNSKGRKEKMQLAQQKKKQERLENKQQQESEEDRAQNLLSNQKQKRPPREINRCSPENPLGLKTPKLATNPDKRPAERVRKIRLYPNNQQLQKLKQAFGVVRWTYNQCVNGVCNQTPKLEPTVKTLRTSFLNATAEMKQQHPWVLEVPYDLRDEGMKDFVQAHKACKTKVGKGALAANGFHFKMRSRKDKSQKLVIHRKHWWAAGVFHPSFFGFTPFRASEPLPEQLDYDCSLTINWLGHVELCLLSPLTIHPQAEAVADSRHPIVSIDPGVRTFATCYDPSAQRIIEWGRNDMGAFYRMAAHADDLQSRFMSPLVGHRRRYRMRRAWRHMFLRIRNWVRDFHYKFANWLCQNYRVVLLPHYDIRDMVRRGSRRINSKSARTMLTWSPCTFRDRLIAVSQRYPGCHVVQLSEAYTSKTCSACGVIHRQLGGNKVFHCPSCNHTIPRDENGACNILLRHLTMLEMNKPSVAMHATAPDPAPSPQSPVDNQDMFVEQEQDEDPAQQEHLQLLKQLLPDAALIQDAFGPNWEDMPLDMIVEHLPDLRANPIIPKQTTCKEWLQG